MLENVCTQIMHARQPTRMNTRQHTLRRQRTLTRQRTLDLDTFFPENNGARMILCGSNDSSVQAESNDTHYDHDIIIIGSRLGP